jgi:inosine/xanthosine triphosphatase
MLKIFVASSNPVKANSLRIAAAETFPDVEVKGIEVPSGVSEQPMTDQETRNGSINRAKNLKELVLADPEIFSLDLEKDEFLFVGAEGGVDSLSFSGNERELWSTVWISVLDKDDRIYSSNGARFKVPQIISDKLLAGGEMGPVVAELFKESDIKRKRGAIGVITKNFIDRTEEYVGIAKLALGLWYGRDWEKDLD